MDVTCGSCKFWSTEIGTPSAGLCCRHAPRPRITNPTEGHGVLNTRWPGTKEEEWCGEWSAKIEIDAE
jgi:hypothetical protein